MINIGFYSEHYKKSWSYLLHYPVILLPTIVFSAITLLIFFAALYGLGIISILQDFTLEPTEEGLEQLTLHIGQFLLGNIGKVIATLMLALIGTFIVGAGTTAAQFGMIRTLLTKKTTSLADGLSSIKPYFWKIVSLRILTFVIYVAAILIAVAVMAIAAFINKIAAVILGIILFSLSFLLVMLAVFVRFPLLYKKNLSAAETLRGSYTFFKGNKRFVITLAAIIAITLAAARFIFNLANIFSGNLAPFIALLTAIAFLVINIFTSIYLFQTFEHYQQKKLNR